MAALARLQSSSCDYPALDLFTAVNGVLVDVYSVAFQIFDKTTGVGVQVYPAGAGTKQAVDVAEDCPDGDRLGAGRYVARWTAPINENLGTHYIKWYIQLSDTSPEQTYTEEFEVLAEVIGAGEYPASNYCLIQDMRDEGYTDVTKYPDSFLQQRIAMASRVIEASTGRFFFPKLLTFTIDGRGGPKLLLSDPIIAVTYVKQSYGDFYAAEYDLLDGDGYRVYNRHITQNLTAPDDRANPKIELTGGVFPRRALNIEVSGYFGYTDYDGSSKGKTPDMIKHACKLMVARSLTKLAAGGVFPRHRVVSETTRDQSYTLSPLGQTGGLFTGDPEIDNILTYFMRPAGLGAV